MRLPNHIQYIIDNYDSQLQARLKGENRNVTVKDAMDTLMACDPSESKKLTDWLVKTYISKGFRWEDVEAGSESKLAEVLCLYQTHFNLIPRDQRNIYLYQSYGELYQLIQPYIPLSEENEGSIGSREIRRRERARALEESDVLYRSQDMIVAVPLTENAAKWWGRGTKWCTAADNNNQFNHYNQKFPLIVITLLNPGSALMNQGSGSSRSAEKIQIWTHDGDIQIMNEADCELEIPQIEKHWKFFEPIFMFMVKQSSWFIQKIPDKFLNLELCKQAVERNGLILNYLPDQFITDDILKIALEQNGAALGLINSDRKTLEFCSIAILQDVTSLRYAPDHLKTLELCTQAVQKNGLCLSYIPARYINSNICKIAIEQNARSLCYVPNQYKTVELCIDAVKKDGNALGDISEEFRTPELCKLALEQNSEALSYVPYELKTVEICKQAVQANASLLYCVPQHLRNAEICKLAILQKGAMLAYVSREHKTLELCLMAVRNYGSALYHVPEEYRNNELCLAAVDQNGASVLYIPESCLTDEILKRAVEQTPLALKYIPENFITYDLARLAVEKSGGLDDIPEKHLTAELIELNKIYRIRDEKVEWNQSLLSNLKLTLNEYFEDKSNETARSYPIHH